MRLLQKAYISYTCNPFKESNNNDQPITSKAFDNSVKNIVYNWNNSAAAHLLTK